MMVCKLTSSEKPKVAIMATHFGQNGFTWIIQTHRLFFHKKVRVLFIPSRDQKPVHPLQPCLRPADKTDGLPSDTEVFQNETIGPRPILALVLLTLVGNDSL